MRHRFLRVLALSLALALSLSISLALTRARSLLLSFLPGGGSDTHRLHTSSSPCHTDRVATPPLREGCHTERVATPAHMCTHTHTHTHTRTHARAHTHTHTQQQRTHSQPAAPALACITPRSMLLLLMLCSRLCLHGHAHDTRRSELRSMLTAGWSPPLAAEP